MKLRLNRLVAFAALFFFALVSVAAAQVGEFGDLANKINDARDTLTTMIQNPKKRDEAQQKRVKDTADAVSAALAKIKVTNPDKEYRFKVLVDTWAAFKKTREEVLVPLILQGKDQEAVSIASGIQAERLGKMISLCEELAY